MRSINISDKLRVAASQNEKAKDFWLKQLSGEINKSSFPCDNDDQCSNSGTKETISYTCPDQLYQRLMKIAANSELRLHIILTAGLTLLLYKYSGNRDIIIGTPIYQPDPEKEYINTALAIRTQISKGITFKELLLQIRQTIKEAHDNYSYPIEILAEKLEIPQTDQSFPLFGTAICLDNLQLKAHITYLSIPLVFQFSLHDSQSSLKLTGNMEYDSQLYRPGTIEQILVHFNNLLNQVMFNSETTAENLDILSIEEKKHILIELNGSEQVNQETVTEPNQTIIDLFESQVLKYPESPALIFQKDVITYKELNNKANRLANYLKKKGVKSDSIVGIMFENALEMVVAILSVWKAGGSYLPIGFAYPQKRVVQMLDDCQATFLLTEEKLFQNVSFIQMQSHESKPQKLIITPTRAQVEDLDSLQIPDRSLVDYEKYRPYIGQAVAKNSIALQYSRGCVYNCAFCFKVWPHKYIVRSAENLFQEIQLYYNMGIRRFAFVDDLPNLDIKNSSRLYELIIKHGLKIHIHFPNGIRGDILTKEHIDLMVEAGTVNMDLALETTSPRLQKLIRKGLKLDKLYENIQYIIEKHPHVILELQIIHGLPTETPEEAIASLNFIKNLKWVHFPYIHILNIYPNSAMAKIAIEHGVSKEAIERSADIAYHELPDTLPFPKHFTKKYQSEFVSDYFMSKERLLSVLPYQMRVLTEDELVQKYNSYLPVEINSFSDLLNYTGISRKEIKGEFLPADFGVVPGFNEKLKKQFTKPETQPQALRVLLLDLSQYFSHENKIIYDVVEPPLGLMYLLTNLNREYPGKVIGKIAKSRIDFDNYTQLKTVITEFNPQVIGIRSLNFYKEFFHKTISIIRQWGIEVPIIAGGPYATSSYSSLLQDHNIDLAVLGEGERTFAQLIGKILENNHQLPEKEILKEIPGLAFIQQNYRNKIKRNSREIVIIEQVSDQLNKESEENPNHSNKPEDLAYIIYTSGSTGKPKGVLIQHSNLYGQITALNTQFNLSNNLNYMLLAAFTFDVSVMHICLPLITGAKLFLLDEITRKDPLKLWQFIFENKIDLLNIVPAFMKALLENLEKQKFHFRYLFVGGDAFTTELYNALTETFKTDQIINIYGPTETTINALLYQCNQKMTGTIVPIGKPLLGYQVYILDSELNLLPQGAAGEITIAGKGLARGYLNSPELTAEKFIKTSILSDFYTQSNSSKRFNTTVYRTGDMGRWDTNKNIHFLGRIDKQVKVRGFRIELGEIEKKLAKQKNIKDAVVITKQDKEGDKYLTAYIVPWHKSINEETFIPEIKSHLAKELPDFMIPSYFVQMEKIPLNINGKVDTNALPTPEKTGRSVYAPPRNSLEETLVQLWAKVIGIEASEIGIDTNFFELGGHSLKATILISKIHKELNVKIPLVELFKTPFIRGLAEYISTQKKDQFQAIQPVEKKEYYPLSSAQKRMYFIQQMETNSTGYNLPLILPMSENLQVDRLEAAIKQLIIRHESLRTSFTSVAGQLVQRVHEATEIKFTLEQISQTQNAQVSVEHHIQNFIRPFDLTQAPLIRSGLIKLNSGIYIWIIDIHHIVADGVSQTVLAKDFLTLYQHKELEPLKLQYKEFSQWQNLYLTGENIKSQEKFWLEIHQDSNEIQHLTLPTDFKRPDVFTFSGDHCNIILEKEIAKKFNSIGNQHNATLYMNFLTLLNVLFYKYTGLKNIIIGSVISGRHHADLQNIIGMFVNTLALKNKPSGEKTYLSFLKEVTSSSIKAFENQDLQFEELIEKLNLQRNLSGNPLFDITMVVQNKQETYNGSDLLIKKPENTPSSIEIDNKIAKFDLTYLVYENEEDIRITIEYYAGIFKEETIQQQAKHIQNIIHSVVMNPNITLNEIEIISKEEKNELLYTFNNTSPKKPINKTIHGLFTEQTLRIPANIALLGRNCNQKSSQFNLKSEVHLSFEELNQKSDQLALILKDRDVEPGMIVGIIIERSIEMIICLLGILKAGAAYLPINPQNPVERIKYLLEESGCGFVLTNFPNINIPNCHAIDLEIIQTLLSQRPKNKLIINNTSKGNNRSASNVAYVIYTSGSTGNPKGVPITHANFSPLLHWGYTLGINNNDRVLQNTSYYFDWSVWEIFITLTSGATLYIIPEEIRFSPKAEISQIIKHCITILHVTPGQFQYLLNVGIPITTLKYLFLGAEKLPIEMIKDSFSKLPAECRIFNMYGPTETTIISTTLELDKQKLETFQPMYGVPIGKPVGNTFAYILDNDLNPCPINIIGELYIGGDGTGMGYLNNPELTRQKFISLPSKIKKELMGNTIDLPKKLYITGDLVRWKSSGIIEFLGRKDFQVKIRGYRIELGEIENKLINHPKIHAAIVIDYESKTKDKFLCAYIVPTEDAASLNPGSLSKELREFLSIELPDYMIPSYFIEISEIPLTPNGKINRKGLQSPLLENTMEYTPPRDEIEEKLTWLWAQVLSNNPTQSTQLKETIGIDDNFFERGGHSLNIAALNEKIKQEFNITVPLVELFKKTTVKSQAILLRKELEKIEYESSQSINNRLVLLKSSSNTAKNVYFIHDGSGDVDGYIELCNQLNIEINCWGITARKPENLAPQNLSIEEMAKDYLNTIKNQQPQGPYTIAGWSIGGTIAFEIVLQLEKMKEEEIHLIMIDTEPPNKEHQEKVIKFDCESELELIKHFFNEDCISKLIENKEPSNISEVWFKILNYLEQEEQTCNLQLIKSKLPEDVLRMIPNISQVNNKELLYYINMIRTLDNVRNKYVPAKKIITPINYLKASESNEIIDEETWNIWSQRPIKIDEVAGDHFSILKQPNIRKTSNKIVEILKSMIQSQYP